MTTVFFAFFQLSQFPQAAEGQSALGWLLEHFPVSRPVGGEPEQVVLGCVALVAALSIALAATPSSEHLPLAAQVQVLRWVEGAAWISSAVSALGLAVALVYWLPETRLTDGILVLLGLAGGAVALISAENASGLSRTGLLLIRQKRQRALDLRNRLAFGYDITHPVAWWQGLCLVIAYALAVTLVGVLLAGLTGALIDVPLGVLESGGIAIIAAASFVPHLILSAIIGLAVWHLRAAGRQWQADRLRFFSLVAVGLLGGASTGILVGTLLERDMLEGVHLRRLLGLAVIWLIHIGPSYASFALSLSTRARWWQLSAVWASIVMSRVQDTLEESFDMAAALERPGASVWSRHLRP